MSFRECVVAPGRRPSFSRAFRAEAIAREAEQAAADVALPAEYQTTIVAALPARRVP
jgi:hypothetical protein